jgi:hypothetical protein
MSTKIKMALAAILVLTTSSAVLAASRHTGQASQTGISQAEQNWFDRASNPNTNGF